MTQSTANVPYTLLCYLITNSLSSRSCDHLSQRCRSNRPHRKRNRLTSVRSTTQHLPRNSVCLAGWKASPRPEESDVYSWQWLLPNGSGKKKLASVITPLYNTVIDKKETVMPPRSRFTREQIIEIAFEEVRKHGWEALSARHISEKLQSSTMPLYSHFKSMRSLAEEIVKKAFDVLASYASTPRTGDAWLDGAIGHVLFAKEEKMLFRCVMDERFVDLRREYSARAFARSGKMPADYAPFEGLSQEAIKEIRMRRTIFTHGLASYVNLSFSPPGGDYDWLVRVIREMDDMLLQWARNREADQEKSDGLESDIPFETSPRPEIAP